MTRGTRSQHTGGFLEKLEKMRKRGRLKGPSAIKPATPPATMPQLTACFSPVSSTAITLLYRENLAVLPGELLSRDFFSAAL